MLALEEFCKTDYRVQRRTDLVTHVRQESLLQQFRLLGFLRLNGQLTLGLHHLRHVTTHAEIAFHLPLRIQQRNHVKLQPHRTATLVAYLRFYQEIYGTGRSVVHTVQRTGDGTTETRSTQTDAAQLREIQLRLVQVVRQFQRILRRDIVHQAYFRYAQGIVHIRDVPLDFLRYLAEPFESLLLMMERLHHLRHVTTCHIDAFQFTSFITDGIDSRLIIHLAVQSQFLRFVNGICELVEIDYRRRSGIVHLVNFDTTVERIVLQQETLADGGLTVCDAKLLTGLLVDACQDTVLVVIHHVHQRRFKHRLVTQHQLVHLLAARLYVAHVMKDEEQVLDLLAVLSTGYGYEEIVDALRTVLLLKSSYPDLAGRQTSLTDGKNHFTDFLNVFTLEKTGKFYRVVFL